MTTTTNSPMYLVNVDPADAGTGYAIIGLVIAQVNKPSRTRLHGALLSFQFDSEHGVGILVRDAAARQHLANALRLGGPKDVTETRLTYQGVKGTGYFRDGTIEDIPVKIWNFEV